MPTGAVIALHVTGWSVFFIALHAAVAGLLRADAKTDLRVSRGIAALLLAAVGTVTIVAWFPLWRQGFLVRQPIGGAAFAVAAFFCGHFVGDFVWLEVLRRTRGLPPRGDLLIHHGLGVAAFAAACGFAAGFTLLGVVMTTELMPAASGLAAWGRHRGERERERQGIVLGYRALLYWRIPLWSFLLLAMATSALGFSSRIDPDLRLASWIASVAIVAVIALDVYWVDEYRRLLRKASLRQGVGVRLRALRPW